MHPSTSNDHFVVSGIADDTVVKSIHDIIKSSTIERVRAWVLKEAKNDDYTPSVISKSKEDHCDASDSENMQTDNAFEDRKPADQSSNSPETRKQLRAKRKEEIRNYLLLKPNVEAPVKSANDNVSETEVKDNVLSLNSLAEQLVVFEGDLLALQSNFNKKLLVAAQTKLSIKDQINLWNQRIIDIHKLLNDDGEAPIIEEQVKFLPGEYTKLDQTTQVKVEEVRRFYLHGTIHDNDYLIYGDVDLSNAAQVAKRGARELIQAESKHIKQLAHVKIGEFDESLRSLRKMQLELSLQLRLRKMFFDIKEKQLEVLLDYDSKRSERDNKLRKMKCTIPVQKTNVKLSEISSKPLLITQSIMENLNCKLVDLHQTLRDKMSEASNLCRQRKHLNNAIAKLRNELQTNKDKCKELQVQKFGKQVESSVLDINFKVRDDEPIPGDSIQNEVSVVHQKEVQNAKRELNKLKTYFLSATKENTRLLREIASLREQQLKIDRDVKFTASSNTTSSKSSVTEMNEYEKLRSLSFQQKKTIDILQQEIKSLKSKCGHVGINNSLGPL